MLPVRVCTRPARRGPEGDATRARLAGGVKAGGGRCRAHEAVCVCFSQAVCSAWNWGEFGSIPAPLRLWLVP